MVMKYKRQFSCQNSYTPLAAVFKICRSYKKQDRNTRIVGEKGREAGEREKDGLRKGER